MNKNSLQHKFESLYTPEPTSGCWLWEGSGERYGKFMYNRVYYIAHRVAYFLNVGPIPDGIYVCHKCDNTFCVNPDHLFLGTQKDNMQDMISKGRLYNRFGINNPRAKFTLQEVYDIIQDTREQKTIAHSYGVSQSTISRIKRKKAYSSNC